MKVPCPLATSTKGSGRFGALIGANPYILPDASAFHFCCTEASITRFHAPLLCGRASHAEFTPLLEIETIFPGDGGKKSAHITVQAMTACLPKDMWKVAMNRYGGEPTLEEVLSDPIIHRLMKADGINMLRLCEIMVKATLALTSPSRAVLAACAGA